MSSNKDWEQISQEDIINTKKHLEIDQEKLKSSFDRLEHSLDEELAKLSAEVIPEISFQQLGAQSNVQQNAYFYCQYTIQSQQGFDLHQRCLPPSHVPPSPPPLPG